jgi:beta-fructofuranosidase
MTDEAVAAHVVRPTFHFTARTGWINDPLGVTFRAGGVDLFYQYVPGTTTWRLGCHWGHATSSDLVSWVEQPVALTPGDGDQGCWSGCIVAGAEVMFYTSVNEPDPALGRVRIARPVDDTWQRWTKGPFVVDVPDEVPARSFRDPFVWRDGERWRMLVGAELRGGTGAVLTYTSHDLTGWSYGGIFAQRHTSERDSGWTGSMWECPQLVRVDAADFLLVSVWDADRLLYLVAAHGTLQEGHFAVDGWQQLTHGSYYAATSFRDDEDQPGLVQWIRNVGAADGGWMGALSVPHRLSLKDGLLVLLPHPRLAAARRGTDIDRRPLSDGDVLQLGSWHRELVVDLGPDPGRLQLQWRDGNSGTLALALLVDPTQQRWTLAAADPAHDCSGPLLGQLEQLTVLLDGALAEVFLGPAGVAAVPIGAMSSAAPELVVSTSPGSAPRVTVWDWARPR